MPYAPTEPWLFAFIQKIRKRPGMYLGSEDVRTPGNLPTRLT
jgi:DNA gyrase/topoisomerase IV subunit B